MRSGVICLEIGLRTPSIGFHFPAHQLGQMTRQPVFIPWGKLSALSSLAGKVSGQRLQRPVAHRETREGGLIPFMWKNNFSDTQNCHNSTRTRNWWQKLMTSHLSFVAHWHLPEHLRPHNNCFEPTREGPWGCPGLLKGRGKPDLGWVGHRALSMWIPSGTWAGTG